MRISIKKYLSFTCVLMASAVSAESNPTYDTRVQLLISEYESACDPSTLNELIGLKSRRPSCDLKAFKTNAYNLLSDFYFENHWTDKKYRIQLFRQQNDVLSLSPDLGKSSIKPFYNDGILRFGVIENSSDLNSDRKVKLPTVEGFRLLSK